MTMALDGDDPPDEKISITADGAGEEEEEKVQQEYNREEEEDEEDEEDIYHFSFDHKKQFWRANTDIRNCRDDANINCTQVLELGYCDPAKYHLDKMNTHELCPVTCGTCQLPKRTVVWLGDTCFEHGEGFDVFYANTSPEFGDFVGIYPSFVDFDADPEAVHNPLLWLYTCGNEHDQCKTSLGGLVFGEYSSEELWLNLQLTPGKYKAALVRGTDDTVLAQSFTFTSKPEDHSCDDCSDVITQDKYCYKLEEDIGVTFEICDPHANGDRIAIYPYNDPNPEENEPLLWLSTCGSQKCDTVTDGVHVGVGDEVIPRGVVTFGNLKTVIDGEAKWPIGPGLFKACLIRTSEGLDRKSSAESETFAIVPDGASCYEEQEL